MLIKAPTATQLEQSLVVTTDLPSLLELPGSARGRPIIIQSDAPVSVGTLNQGSCSSYKSLPSSVLGTIYYITTWEPSQNGRSVIGVLSQSNNNLVSIDLKGNDADRITVGATTFKLGDSSGRFVFNLDVNTYLEMFSSGDLSGSHVSAERSVSIFGGNIDTVVESPTLSDQLISQFAPMDTWGKSFVVPPVPGTQLGYSVKIIAGKAGTSVTVFAGDSIQLNLNNPGDFATVNIDGTAEVTSNNPVQVVRYSKSPSQLGDPSTTPSALLVTSVEQYNNEYIFSLFSNAPYEYFISVVIEYTKKEDLRWNGSPVAGIAWDLVHTLVSNDLVAGTFTAPAGFHSLELANGDFGAFIYGISKGICSFAYPAGMRLQPLYQVGKYTYII